MAAIAGPSKTTTLAPASPPASAPAQPQSQSYFEIVSSNLLKLGALTLGDFLRDPYQKPAPRESFLSNPLYHDAPLVPPLVLDDQNGGNGKPAPTPAPIFVLHQICSQTFGSIDALDYEIIEEEGKEKKRCILTITRPNGASRSYTSKPEFARKAEARTAAAAVAVDMGAIDFIKHGSPEAVAKRGLVLAPLDAPGSVQEPSPGDAEEDPAVAEIEKCCVEWRAGRIKPRWIFLIDSKPTGKYGCALQIKLSLHLFRVFSVDVVHPSFEAAKAACAADAIAEGILDFIKFGNGQTVPAERRLFQPQEDDAVSSAPPIALTLQGFFEALPRPLPEPVDDKTVTEINAPGWLNALIQSARGGKFEHKFIWTTDTKLGTHGAVLRLARPAEVCTYMVEPQFPKRADAKNAVCLVALAAGVGAYIRSIITALETKISAETKTLVSESILPLLTTEYAKFWPNKSPEMFEFTKDRDACGCIMTLQLTGQPEEREKRCWTVPADFRNRNDAKVAVLQLAFEQGAIEFLRFNGEPPPEGYKVELPAPREPKKAKRKSTDTAENESEAPPKKKTKLLSQAEQFLAATVPPNPTEARASGCSWPSQARPATATAAILLPRPGYVDAKPEPGELPAEPPTPEREREHLSTTTAWRPAAVLPFRQTRESQPRRDAEFHFGHRLRGEPRPTYSYGTRGHGRPYELGDARYSGPGVYAPDPYHAPPPAPHTEPWHARPPPPPPPPPAAPVYPEEDGYHRSYYDDDYGRDYDYDYGYEEPGAYAMPGPSRGYADFERSGYDYDDYSHGRSYARTHDPHMPHMPHPHPPLPPPPQPAELAAVPPSLRRRGTPLPSPPRIWELGPRAAHVDARRSGVPPRPPPDPLPLAAAAPESASRSASSSSSSAASAASLTNTHATSSKKELFEYCKVHGYPFPRFFDALDDSENADGPGGAAARYKVWVVLGEERLELPRTYAAVEEGEEKMARKVLRHLRSREMGGAAEEK